MPTYPQSLEQLRKSLDLSDNIHDALTDHELYSANESPSVEAEPLDDELEESVPEQLAQTFPAKVPVSSATSDEVADISPALHRDISPEELQQLQKVAGELFRISQNTHSYLVTGNYAKEGVQTLRFVVEQLNERSNTHAFLMSDLPIGGTDVDLTVVFYLIATYVDTIIIVIDEMGLGSSVEIELAQITSDATLFTKTYALEREDANEETQQQQRSHYLDDILQLIEAHDRLYKWQNRSDLADLLEEIS